MMAKESEQVSGRGGGLDGLQAAVLQSSDKGLPPIHLWNPAFCGDIDMRIAADGTWFYDGTPIGRPALVKLFASVLRREGDKYVLVTPVEKVGISVDDAPFTGVELLRREGDHGEELHLRTNVEDWLRIDAEHPLRFEPGAAGGLKPYARVRGDLWALVKRALFYDLVELGETREVGGVTMFGVASAGAFFPMAEANSIGFAG